LESGHPGKTFQAPFSSEELKFGRHERRMRTEHARCETCDEYEKQ